MLIPVGSEASFCCRGHDILGLVTDRDSLKLFDNGSNVIGGSVGGFAFGMDVRFAI